ncbi:MAG: DUF559 domain-containing protein [Angelakisella sp.]
MTNRASSVGTICVSIRIKCFRCHSVLRRCIGRFLQCKVRSLAIELDGSQHYEEQNAEQDAARTAFLEGYGLTVIRIPNNEVAQNFDGVCAYIDLVVQQSLSQLNG